MQNLSFKFVEEYSAEKGNLKNLSSVQVEQLFACVPLYYGVEEAKEMDLSSIENLFDEEEERWAFATLYHIINYDTEEILYDFWEYNVDSGTIFIHDSKEHIGIFMMQFSFGIGEVNAYSKQLPNDFCDVLQTAFRAATK